MITKITKFANGYEIILDGQTLSVPEAGGNRHYQMVLDAIADGQPVLDPPEPPQPEPIDPKTRDLNKAEFNRLLRLSGLDDAWDAVAAHLKANDRTAYADMMGELDKKTFRLDYTLGQIKALAPIIRASGSRVTAEQVTAIWADVATGKG